MPAPCEDDKLKRQKFANTGHMRFGSLMPQAVRL